MRPFFLSTPIYYVNAKPHLGHAYTTILADCVARFHRLRGDNVFFLTGVDEHGDKIVQAAEKAGQTPKEYCDAISTLFQDLLPTLGVSNDHFVRTTDEQHKAIVQKALQKVYDKGDIYFGEYGGHYCFGCERFYTEKELTEDGLCPDHLVKPEYIAEKNYFFRMSKYQNGLLEHIRNNPDFIRPERYRNEVISLLESGALDDLCISRPKSRLTWGVELPFDENFVTYVWFDALMNYISVLEWPEGQAFSDYWPGAQHLVAKDILKPHAVFWPTMLMAMDVPLYNHLNVHGYWLVRDTKMSKSIGNVIEPADMVERYGLAGFRYFLMREMTFGQDSSFSEEALIMRFNADLANDLGNLFNRSLAMTKKYFDGVVPQAGPLQDVDNELIALCRQSIENCQRLCLRFQFAKGLEALWELVRGLNKYIDVTAPWALAKAQDMERLGTVMYTLLEGMRKVAVHLWPIMPEKSLTMLSLLGITFDPIKADIESEIESFGGLAVGTAIQPGGNLFPRIDVKKDEEPAAKQKKAEKKTKKAASTPQVDTEGVVEFEDFAKLDFRVGTVVSAEPVKKADKLLLVRIDIGESEPRQVVAGIAEYWKPEALVGKQVTMVANLKPRKLRGEISHGMILAVKKEDDLMLLQPTGEVPNGSRVS
ncbi:methionine--tRNA ligase [Desulfovibrio inopinatus]|uniref:methionine--tRNA ligase n=1 Tax=Desulfovibrio inopinatus TaxID=102109 RepID=UPI000481CBBA|nr:methionine--tRNA ligase [Desulfovibrio inopinatus]